VVESFLVVQRTGEEGKKHFVSQVYLLSAYGFSCFCLFLIREIFVCAIEIFCVAS
jgi:hypothetical protein